MRSLSTYVTNALAARALKARNFIWLTGISYTDGSTGSMGFWDDVGSTSPPYYDVSSGTIRTDRTYYGCGSLLSVDNIPLTNDLTVRSISAKLSQIDVNVANMVRGYNLKLQPVEVHRGLYSPGTNTIVDALVPRFVGFVDESPITDPAVNNDGQVELTLVSHTQELTRASTRIRSRVDQYNHRLSGDDFYKWAPIMGQVEIVWGQNKDGVGE